MRKHFVSLVALVVLLSACSHSAKRPEKIADSSFVFSNPVILRGSPVFYRKNDMRTSHIEINTLNSTHRINANDDQLVQEKHALIEEEEFICQPGEKLLKSKFANGRFIKHLFVREMKGIDKKNGYERIIYDVSCKTDYIPPVKPGGKK